MSSTSTIRLSISGSGSTARDPITTASLPEVLQLAELALDLLVDVERLLPLPDASLVACDDELADLLARAAGSAAAAPRPSASRRFNSESTSSGASPRAPWRYALASRSWRISASRASGEAPPSPSLIRLAQVALELDRELALADLVSASRAPSANVSSAIGMVAKMMIRITSPVLMAGREGDTARVVRVPLRKGAPWARPVSAILRRPSWLIDQSIGRSIDSSPNAKEHRSLG